MSNLNSLFDTLRGWPEGSALEATFEPDFGVTEAEGAVVMITTRELAPAKVLRMVDDSLIAAPVLTLLADIGKSYVVAGVGGAWAAGGIAIGDIVEWNGAAWNIIVVNVAGEPPVNTRVVTVEAGGAGSFAGDANKIQVYTAGKPNAWIASSPAAGNRIKLVGVSGVYYNKYYDYTGSAWYKSARQVEAPAIAQKLTSAIKAGNPKDDAWVIIQGNDQFDGKFTNKVTCVKCSSGAVLKLACPIADTLVPGDRVCADTGALKKLTAGAGMEWPIGQVLQSNGVSGATGWVAIATY